MDFCASKYNNSVRYYSACLHSDNYIVLDELEEDDNSRACFPCPFCYVDIEINVLCCHLQEEHCFDLRNAVCPLCADNLGRDATAHFVVQHASSLKRRKRPLKSGFWATKPAALGQELCSFLGSAERGNRHESQTDPLLDSISLSDPHGVQQDEKFLNQSSSTSDIKRAAQCSIDGREEDYEEKRQRAEFVQQLVSSTIF